ncbi:MAG: hypothetical protein ACKVT2_10575, partial [Saprospiraceae bacterium]
GVNMDADFFCENTAEYKPEEARLNFICKEKWTMIFVSWAKMFNLVVLFPLILCQIIFIFLPFEIKISSKAQGIYDLCLPA